MTVEEAVTPGAYGWRAGVTPSTALRRRGLRLRLGRVARLDRAALAAVLVVTLVALLAPVLAPHGATDAVGAPFLAPGHGHLAGTDDNGRDVLSRLLLATRTTWFSVLGILAVSVAIGAVVGAAAGTAGGWLDSALMRITDVFLALPGPLLAIAISAALGKSLKNTVLAIVIVWWPWYARIVRNEVKALRARPFVAAARLAGVGQVRLAAKHLLPGVWAPLLVTASLDAGALIVTLATLSFFGLGAQPPAPELGSMAFAGANYLVDYWWIPLLPAFGVLLLSLVATLAGDAVQALLADR